MVRRLESEEQEEPGCFPGAYARAREVGRVERGGDVRLTFFRSVVCCVRFSSDGQYLATGCNRTAQIYDTKTGAKTQ